MMAPSHILVGACAGALLMNDNPSFGVEAIALSAFGALLPDIDHPSSFTGRRTMPLSWFISKFFSHRGITHSILGVGLLCYALIYLSHNVSVSYSAVAIPLIVGYISHFIGDMFMVSSPGVPLLWPLQIKFNVISLLTFYRVRSLRGFTTGSYVESVIVAGIIVATCYYIFKTNLTLFRI